MQNSVSSVRPITPRTLGNVPTSVIPIFPAQVANTSAIAFLVLLTLLHVIKPELDPSYRFVSEYAVGRHGWVMVITFLTLAISCAAAFVAIRSQITTRSGKVGLVLLAVAAVALAMGGIFPMDPITIAPEDATLHGKLHGLAAMIGIPALPIAAVLISRNLRRLPAWAAGHRVLRWTAHFSWISLVLMDVVLFSTLPADGTFGPDVPIGWPNRLVVLAYALWLMAVARHAQQAARTTSAETQAARLSA